MLLSLNANSLRDVLKRRGSRAIPVTELPRYAQEQTGLSAITLSTSMLVGATRDTLVKVRETGDRVGCACLMLQQADPLSLGDPREQHGKNAVERLTKVVEAASLLGCNSAAVPINAKDDEETQERVISRMRKILERADRLEIQVLIQPYKGLTEDPEKLTELIKAIGGFRIGTFPDFETAVASGDPVQYLKRLTPYASVVNASTQGFEDPEPVAETASETPETPAEPAKEVDTSGMSKDEALLAALEAELDAMDDMPAPVHTAYDLFPLIGALKSVGFDGTVSIEYRGSGDGTLGVLQSRDALEAALETVTE